MANDMTTNPMQVDTAGASSSVTADTFIQGFVVVASADTWSCVVHDAASGNVIFRADSAVADAERTFAFSLAQPIQVTGIYVTTMTDVALLLIYTGGPP